MQQPRFENWQSKSDEVVWKAFQEGSHDALEYIYQYHVKDLFNYGVKLCQDEDIVKDSIQEVFINLWRNRDHLNRKVNIKYYLLKALRRQITKFATSHRNRKCDVLTEASESGIAEDACESQMIKKEVAQKNHLQLATALSRLPERQREVIYLVFYKSIPYEEVAEIMSITKPSVYTLVWKAIRTLKKQLKGVEPFTPLLILSFTSIF